MKKQMRSFFLLLISATLCSCTVTQESLDANSVMSHEDSEANNGVPISELKGAEESENQETGTYTESYVEESHDSSVSVTDEISCTIADTTIKTSITDTRSVSSLIENIPPSTSDEPFMEVNNNIPFFELSDYPSESFEYYSPLDNLGRCGVCVACIGQDMMPTEKRGSIGMVKPSGWQLVRYDGIVDGNYLFNRCHLIGYQLTGENANTSNLITGTRFMNTMGMLPFENETADYVHETGNHVLYRVTPCFEGNNLLVTGVLMEAKSVEDNGTGVMFNVFCYNIQPQIHIDYATGENYLIESEPISHESITIDIGENSNQDTALGTIDSTILPDENEDKQSCDYIVNTNTMKFHYIYCSSVADMKEKNKLEYSGSRDELIEQGYSPCGRCKP